MADNRSRVCATCGAEDMELLQCSKCKQRYYCSVECQRVDWRSHKRSCHRLDTQRTPEQSRPRRCPYRPDTVSNSTGVCPFRDLVEESQLQEIIDKDLANGVNGMNELAGCRTCFPSNVVNKDWRDLLRCQCKFPSRRP